ncbi:MAG: PIN domain nuclease [Chloroflexi bacterium]|nr:PIN domain nuclease [Chloroflexota bacterium]
MVSNIGVRALGALLLGLAGWQAGERLGGLWGASGLFPWGIGGIVAGVVVGAVGVPYLIVAPARLLGGTLQRVSAARMVAGVVGLALGLLVAAVVSAPLSRLQGWPGIWVPLGITLALAFLGVLLGMSREGDVALLFSGMGRARRSEGGRVTGQVVVDTSAIIDGRLVDIMQTGFLSGPLVIPRFVLDELRHVADSTDSLRRSRGRRGLEMLNKLRKETTVPIQVLDLDRPDGLEVDGKLVQLAKHLGAPIVTTDYNLNRVAEIQGVRVLNVNQLANALKSAVLPGEDLEVQIIQEGKELGQGIGFLDDGTMVIVENGRRYLNTRIPLTVTRVLQTAAGRLIFAQTKTR